jgi:cardiolipin synthase
MAAGDEDRSETRRVKTGKHGRRRRGWKMLTVVFVAHVLGLISSFHAVMSTRTSQGAIAWAVSLNAFPYVSVPAYWVLGRNKFNGYVVARRANDEASHDRLRELYDAVEPYVVAEQSEAARAAVRLAELPILRGNEVELLIDGRATFDTRC